MESNKPVGFVSAFTNPFGAIAEFTDRQNAKAELKALQKQPITGELAEKEIALQAKVAKLDESKLTTCVGIKSRAVAVFCVFFFNVSHAATNLVKLTKVVVCIPADIIRGIIKLAGKDASALNHYGVAAVVKHAAKVVGFIVATPTSVVIGLLSPSAAMKLQSKLGLDSNQVAEYNTAVKTAEIVNKAKADSEQGLADVKACYIFSSADLVVKSMKLKLENVKFNVTVAEKAVAEAKANGGVGSVAKAEANLVALVKAETQAAKLFSEAVAVANTRGNVVTMPVHGVINQTTGMVKGLVSWWNKKPVEQKPEEKPAEKPADKPADKPAETPAQEKTGFFNWFKPAQPQVPAQA